MVTRTDVRGDAVLRRVVGSVNWLGIGVIVGLLVLWELLVRTDVLDYDSLPGPTEIWDGFTYLIGPEGGLWDALWHTIRIVTIAWLIGTGLGAVLGVILSSNQTLASWTSATIDVLRSLPVVALIPIAILVWGNGDQAEIILGAYAALWPMMINTVGGVRAVPARLREVARTLGLSRGSAAVKIVMPAAGSAMLVGARLALASALVICVVAEMLGLQSGVGNQLVLEQSGGQSARMWVYVLLTGILGVIANYSLVYTFRILLPGLAAVSERSA